MPIGFHPLELVLILAVLLLIFGPKRLPEMGSAIGKSIKEFRKGINELTSPKDEHEEENKSPATAAELPADAAGITKLNATTVESDAPIKETVATSEVKSKEVEVD